MILHCDEPAANENVREEMVKQSGRRPMIRRRPGDYELILSLASVFRQFIFANEHAGDAAGQR